MRTLTKPAVNSAATLVRQGKIATEEPEPAVELVIVPTIEEIKKKTKKK